MVRSDLARGVLDEMRVFDQKVALARSFTEQLLDFDLGAMIDLTSLWNRPRTRASTPGVFKALHVGMRRRFMVLHGAILLTGPANTKAIVERQDPPGRLSKLNLRQWGRAVGSQADQVAESALCGIGRDAFSNVVALHHAFAQLRQPGPARIWRNLFGCDQWAAKEELEPFDDMSGMVMV